MSGIDRFDGIVRCLMAGSTEGLGRYRKEMDALDRLRGIQEVSPIGLAIRRLSSEEGEDDPFQELVSRVCFVIRASLNHFHPDSKCDTDCLVIEALEDFKLVERETYDLLCQRVKEIAKYRLPANIPCNVGELLLQQKIPLQKLSEDEIWEAASNACKERFTGIHRQAIFRKIEALLNQFLESGCSEVKHLQMLEKGYFFVFNDLCQSMYEETVKEELPSPFPFEIGKLILTNQYSFYSATQEDFKIAVEKTLLKVKESCLRIEIPYLIDRTAEIDAFSRSFITTEDVPEIRNLLERFLTNVKIGHPADPSYTSFVSKVMNSLKQLASTQTGYSLLDKIARGSFQVTIQHGGGNYTWFTEHKRILVLLSLLPGSKMILKRSTGQNYLAPEDFSIALAHELVHAYHAINDSVKRNKSIRFESEENIYFTNEEEMITVLGHNISRSFSIYEPISENAIRYDLGMDARVSHYFCSPLPEEMAYFGVDEAFQEYLNANGKLEESQRLKCLERAVRGAAVVFKQYEMKYHLDGRVQALENHLRIIESLLKRMPDRLEFDYEDVLRLPFFQELIVIFLNRLGGEFPLHKALAEGAINNLTLIEWHVGAIFCRRSDTFSKMILSTNEEGLTVLEIAKVNPRISWDVIQTLENLYFYYSNKK